MYSSRFISIDLEQQQQTYWCWLATAVSVSRYYDRASRWTQLMLADELLAGGWGKLMDRDGNALDILTGGYNKPGKISESLKKTGNFSQTIAIDGLESKEIWEILRREIHQGRPIIAGMDYNSDLLADSGHAIVIKGYTQGNSFDQDSWRINWGDPWNPGSVKKSEPFVSFFNLQNKAKFKWMHLTKA